MINIQEFDEMIETTAQKYGNMNSCLKNVLEYINQNITPKEYASTITRENGARKIAEKTTNTEILELIETEIIKIYNTGNIINRFDSQISNCNDWIEKNNLLNRKCPYYNEVSMLVNMLSNKEINTALFFKQNPQYLIEATNIVFSYRFLENKILKEAVDKYGYRGKEELFNKIKQDTKIIEPIRKININNRAINKCYEELKSGKQLINQRNEYILDGTLYATQDIGKKRGNQEDTVVIMTHPENRDFKFLAVSDGMGGEQKGEMASSLTLQVVSQWFENLSPDEYADPNILTKFQEIIKQANTQVAQQYPGAGATFTGAIVAKDNTYICNVGDSRAYIIKDNEAKLVTKDESLVMVNLEATKPNYNAEDIDNLRFNRNNNQILGFIGNYSGLGSIQSHILKNNQYNQLIVMTDGVSDLLSNEQISYISKVSPIELFTKRLVNAATTIDAKKPVSLTDDIYKDMISAGKDNATVAMVDMEGARKR